MQNNTLHLIRTSPFNKNDILLCCDVLSAKDSIVLLDDGCYSLNHESFDLLLSKTKRIFIIEIHALSRGLAITDNIQPIDLTMLNKMIFEHLNSVTWQ
ncbi:MAG: sulfurtransferase complex subunit TusB [Colwelliaceae bacterium]|jgi:tRNA 2-thiouridine synthesizing protein B|nr:sulfurtransferase complex subunit TusB [Colwelliaceae bacterium]